VTSCSAVQYSSILVDDKQNVWLVVWGCDLLASFMAWMCVCVCLFLSLFSFCRWTLKIFPFCSSELLFDALQLAIAAREVDVRASPYDLTAYQLPTGHNCGSCSDSDDSVAAHSALGTGMSTEPICIETAEVSSFVQKYLFYFPLCLFSLCLLAYLFV
jgi:hypothetical protein